jgi:segregation and condensation protein A
MTSLSPTEILSSSGALPHGDDLLVVEIDRFQGPLDLLLHLIRKQDLDIFDIPIARITRQFLAAIQGIQASDLDSAGEFLDMAATLVRIKSQLLLPRPMEDEDEDPRAELVRRLLEYEQIREIVQRLEAAEGERARRFGKGYVEPRPPPPAEDVPLETTWDDVFEVALEVEVPEPRGVDHRIMGRLVSMEEKATLILETLRLEALKEGGGIEFRRLLEPFRERMHGVMTFLAGLELTRRRRVLLRQSAPFHELWLYLRDEALEEDEEAGPGAGPAGDAPRDPPTQESSTEKTE